MQKGADIMEPDKMLRALGEPMRFKIYGCLLERKHCVRSLSKKLGITESAVSQHIRIMREAGLVYGEKYGYHTHYLPSQEALDALVSCFAEMKEKSLSVSHDTVKCRCEYREVE